MQISAPSGPSAPADPGNSSSFPGGNSLTGQCLSHYLITEKIGAGGMGEVYRARDEHLDREVAIKVLPAGTLSDELSRKQFRKEAVALSRLNHPNIATIHDFDTQQGIDFLVMEYIPGISLSEKLAAGPLPEKELLRLAIQLAEGLSAAHEHGVVHRDLKPGNLRVTPDGWLKILDFGLAKLRQPSAQSAATESFLESRGITGTLPYMAPEQVLGGEIDARTDIYGLGVVLYEMATQQWPFRQQSTPRLLESILHQGVVAPRALNPRISPELERIILKCLEKEAENRYQSAKELAVDLRRLQRETDSGKAALQTAAMKAPAQRWWLGRERKIVGALAFLALTITAAFFPRRAPKIDSVAVLPFVNVTADPNSEYLGDGLTEDLISSLSQLPDLAVRPQSSVLHYKGKETDPRAVARDLNVAALVSGRVTVRGDTLIVAVELADMRTNRNLWSEHYDRKLSDLLAIQHDIAGEISARLWEKLAPQEAKNRPQVTRGGTSDPEAYQLYLKGRYYWEKRTPETLEKSRDYFTQAIAKDPGYAVAYVGLADYWLTVPSYAPVPLSDATPKAKAAGEKALSLDDQLPAAHLALAMTYWLNWEWATAEREFQHTLELDPNLSNAHHWYGNYLSLVLRPQEAITHYQRAVELEPFNLAYNEGLGWGYSNARMYDRAIEQLNKTLEMDPNFAAARADLAEVYLRSKHYDKWLSEWEKAALLYKLPQDIALVKAAKRGYARDGFRAAMSSIIEEQLKQKKSGLYVDPEMIAYHYAWLGDREQTFRWLETAVTEKSAGSEIRVEPALDPFRSDPRYRAILRQMGFPE